MYTKATLQESIRRFENVLVTDNLIRGVFGPNEALTDRELIMVDGAVDTIKSHVEALEVIEDLREDLRIANATIEYWANR